MKNSLSILIIAFLLLACQEASTPVVDQLIQTKVNTSVTAGYSESKNAYFGDLHVHSSWSFDAFIYNVRTSPDQAYQYGKGEPIAHVSGTPIQIQRPLDFMAVADHSEYMGVMIQMSDQNNPLSQLDIAERINTTDPNISRNAFNEIGNGIATNAPDNRLIKSEDLQSTWQRMVAAADRNYEPGTFTTFPAYEWTSSLGVVDHKPQYAQNLHRNVIYKGGKVSAMPFSSFHSQNPEDLWSWMEDQRSQGVEVIAIPHNGNISDGRMYAMEQMNGAAIDETYANTRSRNEPINEVVQIKGQSMAHPELSPNDEFAEFEMYQHTLGRGEPRVQSKANGSFVRQAYQNGIAIEQTIGINPFEFGIIGSSDGHNGASNIEEDNNIGKSGLQDPTAKKRMDDSPASARNRQTSVAGLAGVWAKENTRESLFESFEKKEVYATSGTRIQVRFFGGWKLNSIELGQPDWVLKSYQEGTPMGGVLQQSSQKSDKPTFIIWATKDSDGANLDRIQVVKGWVDKEGMTNEKLFNVAWSDNRTLDNSGSLPDVGTTVDLSTASYTNDIGSVTLQTTWVDPEFDKEISSFYYLRVLEIPTPRWTTYDAVSMNVPLPKEVPPSIQERAWSSPIWYKPQ